MSKCLGNHCVAPGCDYRRQGCKDKRSLFGFPSEPNQQQMWTRNLKRKDFHSTNASKLCEIHFEKHLIVRDASARRPDGTTVSYQLQRPKLTKDAVPTVFSSNFVVNNERGTQVKVPSYVSKKTPKPRKNPDERRIQTELREKSKAEAERQRNLINTFPQLLHQLGRKTLPNQWTTVVSENCVNLMQMNRTSTGHSVIAKELHITDGLVSSFCVYREGKPCLVPLPGHFKHVGSVDSLWDIFAWCDCYKDTSPLNLIAHVISILNELTECHKENSEKAAKIQFLTEQVSLLGSEANTRRYSPELYAWSAALKVKSPAAYRFISESSAIVIPSNSSLRRVMNPYRSGPGLQKLQEENLKRLAAKHPSRHEKTVYLHIDELSVRPAYSYKGRKITRQAQDSSQPATDIVGFMITGALSSLSEMVMLMPARNLTGDTLYEEIMKVMGSLESHGFIVASVITDNHRKNQRLFARFAEIAGVDLNLSCIPHPFDPSRPLFPIMDPVHIIKCIRNNWHQRVRLFYPCPEAFFSSEGSSDDDRKAYCANWEHLLHAYSLESSGFLKVTELNARAVAPNSMEKQNVNLALKVISEKTARGLEVLAENHSLDPMFAGIKESILLIDTFNRIWAMWNIKNTTNSFRYRIDEMHPFRDVSDVRFHFMAKFRSWVAHWYQLAQRPEYKKCSLTVDTFKALLRTLDGLPLLVKYLLGMDVTRFVLTGKISNGPIEGRFRLYRSLSGSTYLVSVTEVFESQAKLQLTGHLSAHKVLFGTARLNLPPKGEEVAPVFHDELVKWFLSIFDPAVHFPDEVEQTQHQILLFIGGYCAFEVGRKISCAECTALLKLRNLFNFDSSSDSAFAVITKRNRGGLSFATGFSRTVVRYCYYVYSVLCGRENLDLILNGTDQHRKAIMYLTEYMLEQQCPDLFTQSCTTCLSTSGDLVQKMISVCTNTMLNNLQQKCNDEISRAKRSLTVKRSLTAVDTSGSDCRKLKKFKK